MNGLSKREEYTGLPGLKILAGLGVGFVLISALSWRVMMGGAQAGSGLEAQKMELLQQVAAQFDEIGQQFIWDEWEYRVPLLQSDLEALRALLARLERLPLTDVEHAGLAQLSAQERRLRTALYALVDAASEDPSWVYAESLLKEAKQAVTDALTHVEHTL